MKSLKEQLLEYVPYNEQESNDKNTMLTALEKFDNVFTRDCTLCHFTSSN